MTTLEWILSAWLLLACLVIALLASQLSNLSAMLDLRSATFRHELDLLKAGKADKRKRKVKI